MLLSASQPKALAGSKRTHASSCTVAMTWPREVDASNAITQRSLLSVERTTTKARLPSSDQSGMRSETSRSFGLSSVFSVFCSVSSFDTFMPCSNHFWSPFAVLRIARREGGCRSPTFSRDGMVSAYAESVT